MRKPIEQNQKTNGPLGIRTGVWLIVFGEVLVCLIAICLSPRQTSQASGDTAAESVSRQESSTRKAGFRRTAHLEVTPAASEGEASYDIDEAQMATIEQMTQDRRTWIDVPVFDR